MPKYKLTLAYDGTHYVGWQIQSKGLSIQGYIEKALFLLLKKATRVIGSGRTDAGTHALGQVAHFETDSPIDPKQFLRHLNGILPEDIRILHLELVSPIFHAQYSAHRKTYHYHLWLEPVISPFVKQYRYHVRYPLDCALLAEAAHYFVGTHDFTSFANVGSTDLLNSSRGAVRTLFRFDLIPQEGGVRFECEGDGFLYKMVRNCIGTLLEVASGKRPMETVPLLLTSKDRSAAGAAAPATGLFLVSVHYEPNAMRTSDINI